MAMQSEKLQHYSPLENTSLRPLSSVDVFVSSNHELMQNTLSELLPRFSTHDKYAYSDASFESESPIGNDTMSELVDHVVQLNRKDGINLWIQSEDLRYISENEASHRALDRVYSGPIARNEELDKTAWSHVMLGNLKNAMAVRNRKRVVEQVYATEITNQFHFNSNGRVMDVLSIAAGSSRPIMQTLSNQSEHIKSHTKLRLMDSSRNALNDGSQLASELGISEALTLKRSLFTNFDSYMEGGYQPDFVEIVGLLDYVPRETAVTLLSKVKNNLKENGSVLFANVVPNSEQAMLHEVIGWRPMIYRSAEEVYDLAIQAGFTQDSTQLISEPVGLCNLILARK